MQDNPNLINIIKKNDANSFLDFKLKTSISQKDAVLFFLIFISRADETINSNEEKDIEELETFLYSDITEPSDVAPQNMEQMFLEINTLSNTLKRFFVQIICGHVATNMPIKQNKAGRIGYIIERIGIDNNEFESILLERMSKNAILGKMHSEISSFLILNFENNLDKDSFISQLQSADIKHIIDTKYCWIKYLDKLIINKNKPYPSPSNVSVKYKRKDGAIYLQIFHFDSHQMDDSRSFFELFKNDLAKWRSHITPQDENRLDIQRLIREDNQFIVTWSNSEFGYSIGIQRP